MKLQRRNSIWGPDIYINKFLVLEIITSNSRAYLYRQSIPGMIDKQDVSSFCHTIQGRVNTRNRQ